MTPLRTFALFLSLLPVTAGLARADAALAGRARATLQQVAAAEEGWIKVHAADAYLALRAPEEARAVFASAAAGLDQLPHRVGLMRTFAQAARSPDERARWLRAIEAVFMDPDAPDRLQAIETIGKLGHPLTGEALEAAREFAATRPEAEATLAHWALAHAEEPTALPALQKALESPEGIARLRAAYALRWLRPPDLEIRAKLAAAATTEPADSPAYVYLISAALSLHPNHPQTPAWHATLERLLHHGAPPERYEAAQTLMRRYSRPQLERLAPLFDHPHGDVRLAAAWTVLHVLRD